MENTKKLMSKSMMNISTTSSSSFQSSLPPSPDEMSRKGSASHLPRFRIFSFSGSSSMEDSPKRKAKKFMKESTNGYGSYSNLFRAQSYDSLCANSRLATTTTAAKQTNKEKPS